LNAESTFPRTTAWYGFSVSPSLVESTAGDGAVPGVVLGVVVVGLVVVIEALRELAQELVSGAKTKKRNTNTAFA
jgi:hypothetical protein